MFPLMFCLNLRFFRSDLTFLISTFLKTFTKYKNVRSKRRLRRKVDFVLSVYSARSVGKKGGEIFIFILSLSAPLRRRMRMIDFLSLIREIFILKGVGVEKCKVYIHFYTLLKK